MPFSKGYIPWNKNLTKEKDKRLEQHSENLKKIWRNKSLSEKLEQIKNLELGRNNRVYKKGWHHTRETKEKIARTGKGVKKPQVSLALKGRKITWGDKISKARKGQPSNKKGTHLSQSTIEKIRRARLRQVLPRKDTSIEVKLQNKLKERGFKFETHYPILGQPDIFINPNLCIFADGDYWHGSERAKIRDMKITQDLRKLGYRVLRFWGHEIREDLENCINRIESDVGEEWR